MRNIPGWLFLLAIVGFVGATVLCSVVGYTVAQRVSMETFAMGIQVSNPDAGVSQVSTVTPFPTLAPTDTPMPETTITPEAVETEESGVSVQAAATRDPLADLPQLNDPRRITILLMGIDERKGFENESGYRSDTMILVSIDPVGKRVGMLSIPRDLWVPIPGFTQGRINTANQLGDANELPGGGPALAAKTVEAAFGIPVDNYIRVNFDFFLNAVDVLAPNGIEVCPNEVIDDPTYPDAGFGMIHVHFEAGCQRLDSERLLQYARTRKTQNGDFDRARRQQEVLKSIQREFLSVGGIANFITQAPTLWDQLSENVVTNLNFDQILQLAGLASQVDSDDITSGVIDAAYVEFATTAQGDQILVPRYARIGELIEQVFNPRPNMTMADLRVEAERENARIVVYNNTTITGLAGQTRDWLLSRQVSIETIGSMESPTNTDTVIRDYTSKPWTARYLAALLGIPETRIQRSSDGLTSADIMIVVGEDIQPILGAQPTSTP